MTIHLEGAFLRLVRAALVAAAACVPPALSAAVVAPVSFDRLVGSADVVFTGTVVRVDAMWQTTSTGRAIVSRVTFRVDRAHKGRLNREIALQFLGGRIGDVTLEVSGVPAFTVGQQDVICARTGAPAISPVVGLNQGRFRVNVDQTTGRRYVTTHDGFAIASVSEIGRTRATISAQTRPSMALETLEQEIARVQREAVR